MLGNLLKQTFNEYQDKGLRSPKAFIDYAAKELKIDRSTVERILNSSTWYQELSQNLAQIIKDDFNNWRRQPVCHNHKNFVNYLSTTYSMTSEEIKELLKNADWYIDL